MKTALLGFLLVAGMGSARAETATLESTALRLEVTTDPYAYRVIAKANSQVLVAQSRTQFTIAVGPPDGGAAPSDGGAVSDGGTGPGDAGVAPADGGSPLDAPAEDAAAPEAGTADAALDAMPGPTLLQVAVARAASATVSGPTTLDATLVLANGAGTGVAHFEFLTPEVLAVTLSVDGTAGRLVREEFTDQQEHVYGIWEYPFGGSLDNRGVDRDYLGLGLNQGSNATSGHAPFYLTSRGYGVYVRSDHRGHFTVAVGGTTSFLFENPALTYYVVHGPSYEEMLSRYRVLAGAPLMPPLWALGTIWWSDDFNQDLHGPDAQSNVLDLATQLQSHHIPASGLLIDRPFGTGLQGWGNMDFSPAFPDPAAMVAGLHDRGLQLMVWIANRAWNKLYDDGLAQGFLFPGGVNLGPAVDVRSPAAYAWMKARLEPLATLASAYKIDRGEQGEIPGAYQNEVITLFATLAREGLVAHHGDDAFQIARDVADTGRQQTAVWNGDAQATFEGLQYSIAGGLRSGLILMPMWGSDNGGYLRNAGAPTEEVFARWLGFGAWSPMMEVLVGQGHTPWYEYSPALVEIARKHAATHFDLIPYTRSFLHAASATGAPVIRPLFFAYPDEPALADEYLYGSELLVAPVITAGATTRALRVPPGQWLDYNGRHQAFGPGMATLPAPLDTIPVLVREGAIVTRGALLRGNDDWTTGWAARLRLEVFPAQRDLDRQVDYFTGTEVRPIHATTAGGTLTVRFDDLGAPGAVEVQTKTVGKVSAGGKMLAATDYRFDGRVLSVPFTGATTLVVEGVTSVFVPDPSPDAGADATGAAPPSSDGGCSCSSARGRPVGPIWLLVAAVSYRAARRRRAAAP
jgi:alpha-D-xyloside xylohydrolase